MTRLVVGPFNRVEGDLEVQLDLADGHVAAALVSAPLYRGFEHILQGRPPGDALVIAPRVCGICSVAQSAAAAAALADIGRPDMPGNGRLALDLIQAAENVADHLTHFHLFFMPDFARAAYAGRSWHTRMAERFAAGKGAAAQAFLPARAQFLHLMGLLAGKWPHSLAIQPGGTTKGLDGGERVRLLAVLAGFRRFVEEQVLGDGLEAFAALATPDALAAWAEQPGGDLRLFLRAAADLGLHGLGRGPGLLMCRDGVWRDGRVEPLDTAAIAEDVSHAWQPDAEREDGYTWCKAPRLAGSPVEVGAFARQTVAGQPLIRALALAHGSNVRDRVLARMVETARLLIAMEGWARDIRPRDPFCADTRLPGEGGGIGLVEAARGTLGHWVELRDGRIADYQIIAPTTWNFSPRDAAGVPGPLEQALAGTPVAPGETVPVAVQHVVRSFDPCMVCTVH